MQALTTTNTPTTATATATTLYTEVMTNKGLRGVINSFIDGTALSNIYNADQALCIGSCALHAWLQHNNSNQWFRLGLPTLKRAFERSDTRLFICWYNHQSWDIDVYSELDNDASYTYLEAFLIERSSPFTQLLRCVTNDADAELLSYALQQDKIKHRVADMNHEHVFNIAYSWTLRGLHKCLKWLLREEGVLEKLDTKNNSFYDTEFYMSDRIVTAAFRNVLLDPLLNLDMLKLWVGYGYKVPEHEFQLEYCHIRDYNHLEPLILFLRDNGHVV